MQIDVQNHKHDLHIIRSFHVLLARNAHKLDSVNCPSSCSFVTAQYLGITCLNFMKLK
jgi:hypothetical protein